MVLVAGIVDATALLPFGVGDQERQFIPLTAMFLVLCGWIVQRHHERLRTVLPSAVPVIRIAGIASSTFLVLLWLLAWLASSRKSANGLTGPWNFATHPQWSPPLGWDLWIAMAAIGALLACAGAVGCLLGGPDGEFVA